MHKIWKYGNHYIEIKHGFFIIVLAINSKHPAIKKKLFLICFFEIRAACSMLRR